MLKVKLKKLIYRVMVFELDTAAVKPYVTLSNKQVSTSELGEYIFALPRCGEFFCDLGEIRDGELIHLHRDNYCMK